jgi:hypothetical protein
MLDVAQLFCCRCSLYGLLNLHFLDDYIIPLFFFFFFSYLRSLVSLSQSSPFFPRLGGVDGVREIGNEIVSPFGEEKKKITFKGKEEKFCGECYLF